MTPLATPAAAADACLTRQAGSLRQIYGPRWPWLFALYLALAVICGYQSWSRVVVDAEGKLWTNQSSVDSVVSGLSDEPIGTAQWALMRSRVLMPLLIVRGNDYFGIPHRITHDALRLLCIFAALLLLHWHFRAWFTPLESLAGTVLIIASITITFNGFYPIITDFPELVAMTACVGFLVRRQWIWMLVAVAAATLNRETSVIFLAVAICVLYGGRKDLARVLAVAASIAVTWWVSFMLARHLAGVAGDWIQPPEGTSRGRGLVPELVGVFVDIWDRRADSFLSLLSDPHPYNVNWSLFLVLNVFWILPLFHWRSVPVLFRRLYVGGLLAGAPLFVLVGVLNEAGRHMIPLYPMLMPAGIYVLSRFILTPADPLVAAPDALASRDELLSRDVSQKPAAPVSL